jgi:hypothetical protein
MHNRYITVTIEKDNHKQKEKENMPESIHSFEDAVEFCLAIVDDAKNLKQAHDKINSVLCSVHEQKFEKIRYTFCLFGDGENNNGDKKNGKT